MTYTTDMIHKDDYDEFQARSQFWRGVILNLNEDNAAWNATHERLTQEEKPLSTWMNSF